MIWLFIVITYISSFLCILLLTPRATDNEEVITKFLYSIFSSIPVTWFLSTAMVAMGAF